MPIFGAGTDTATASAPLKFLLAVILIAGWAVYLQSTRRALGMAGAILVAAICGGLVWLLASWNVLSMQGDAVSHVLLICTAILLTVGLSWSHLSRRLTGQTDTDLVE
jgi:ABC-type branched-subunit amino acid transport system permease subunit